MVKVAKRFPYKIDNSKKAGWLKAYAKVYSFTGACEATHLTRQAIYDALDRDPKFAQDKQAIDDKVDDVVESRLFTHTGNNPVACFFWLSNRRKAKWQSINKVEHSGEIAQPVKISDEEKRYLEAIGRALIAGPKADR